jgi:hypothetical protein
LKPLNTEVKSLQIQTSTKTKKNTKPMIYAYALDNILCAMKGKRIFDRFGFNLTKTNKKHVQQKLIINFDEFKFSSNSAD